ncbi:hypothetical protein [Halobaculum lipolyticum]|uniref:Uncharacterized protein n=1 Tax=Halobaculum lipolyticum TaxID=3032001 RepID=A0ABD5W8I9_9EURY|nr:hypothetical protein [Halobaculum sp. DT31]
MDRDRLADVALGAAMIAIGSAPAVAAAVGAAPPEAGGLVRSLPTPVAVVVILCGLVLAVGGAFVIRYGRSRTATTGLY